MLEEREERKECVGGEGGKERVCWRRGRKGTKFESTLISINKKNSWAILYMYKTH